MTIEQPSTIPFHNFGGQGDLIHFAHANGYPPEGYKQLFQPFLAKYKVIGSKFRPLWGEQSPEAVNSWTIYANDLIQFLDQNSFKNIIGMGHSMGGTISVEAAFKRPDLFKQLVLIDPVIFPYSYFLLTKFLPKSLLKGRLPIAKRSAKRRYQWKSKEEVFKLWREKKVFKRFSDTSLKDFIAAAIIADEKGGVTLAYSREWETQVYLTGIYIYKKILQLKVPVTIIRAEKTNVIPISLWKEWQKKRPDHQFIEYNNSTHLLPLEYPKELADLILKTVL